jgi:hypothetical protein
MFGMRGSEPATRPLHRLTPLRDEPAVAWLSPAERTRVETHVWLLWTLFWGLLPPLWLLVWIGLATVLPIYSFRVSVVIMASLVAALFRAVRRAILRTRSERIEQLLRRNGATLAADDWDALAAAPNDTVASVVGWVRGRQHFDRPIGGESVVGVALPLQHHFPGVFESLHDFDLVDEEGRSIFIQAADGRMFGTPNVPLDSHELRLLYSSLGVPSGATPSGWYIHGLRDGDPVMVLGTKQTVLDPDDGGFRGPAPRLALASSRSPSPSCPLLIFSISAERRSV